LEELDENVKQLIEEGFEPFGNPYFIGSVEGKIGNVICQAMTSDKQSNEQEAKMINEIKKTNASAFSG